MKGKIVCVAIGLISVLVNGLNAQMTKSELQQMYVTYLKQEGYQPEVDSDGDVSFKAEGKYFYISVDENDLEVFTIVFPYFWEIESASERREALSAASNANRTTKIAKIYLTGDDDTSIRGQTCLVKPDDFKLFFRRMIDAIMAARRKFIDEML
ncbi:MAG: YbjN domain-containing protein [Treponema sp.]|jgi:hypothetical protein|nr:YbjN domain-containing protein [Treponema sp.]